MMDVPFIKGQDVEDLLNWTLAARAIERGHLGAEADFGDLLLTRNENSLLNRAAWLENTGIALKSVTVFPGNPGKTPPLPAVQGVVILFDDKSGQIRALIEGALVTRWKTAADSVLGARFLARSDARHLLIVGTGVVAASLIEAYGEIFPLLEQISIWGRSPEKAMALAEDMKGKTGCSLQAITDLPAGVARADIIACATSSHTPVLFGEWVRPGTHVDLVGAYRPDMREADDDLMKKASIFVDARATTIGEIGELMLPISRGVISATDIRGDLRDLCRNSAGRKDQTEITVFKNGGGAHLDLMVADLIFQVWNDARSKG